MKVALSMGVKGGVAKTTVAINLAHELSNTHNVGMLDADVDSPNLGTSMVEDHVLKQGKETRHFIPAVKTFEGHKPIKVMSTAFFGKGLSIFATEGRENKQIINDMMKHTKWGGIDVLVVDLPAGSGDELLGVLNAVPLSEVIGAVLVTLPVTSDDLRRATVLCARFGVRVVGVIENCVGALSKHGHPVVCVDCGETYYPFPSDGKVKAVTDAFKLDYFGSLPLVENFGADHLFPENVKGPISRAAEKIRRSLT